MAVSQNDRLQLIVGLGNPGPNYKDTRHNAGAWFIETLLQNFQLSLKMSTKFQAEYAEWSFSGNKYYLLLPHTYMNHSGQAIAAFAKYYDIQPNAILIAHDELDFAAGIYRFKKGGGHAGHNGLRDAIHHLNSREFSRIRIGIGHPGSPELVSDYVLSKPSKEDKQKIEIAIQEAIIYLQGMLSSHSSGVNHGL